MKSKASKSIPDRVLLKVDLKVLQGMMEDAGLSETKMEELRQRRRRLQNRLSAKISAARRQGKYEAIAQSNENLQCTIDELKEQNAELVHQLTEARRVAKKAVAENQALQQEIACMSSELLESPGNDIIVDEFDSGDSMAFLMDSPTPMYQAFVPGMFDSVPVA